MLANLLSVSNRPRSRRRGITIVEMLVAGAVALIMMTALVAAFGVVSETVKTARASIEMSSQLRSASHRLHEDLRDITSPVRPWLTVDAGLGYFEIVEGPRSALDVDNDGNPDVRDLGSGFLEVPAGWDTTIGDLDDVIMFTARSDGDPYIGRYQGTTIESAVAEIIWWIHFDPRDDRNLDGVWNPGEQLTIRRRVMLVRPDLAAVPAGGTTLPQFYQANDVSVHAGTDGAGNPAFIPNSLGDLTKRQNRFAHTSNFPHLLHFSMSPSNLDPSVASWLNLGLTGNREGEDVVLSNVVGFDIQVYDPLAPLLDDGNGYALAPGDPGYPGARSGRPGTDLGYGAFVDLNYSAANGAIAPPSHFSGAPQAKSQLNIATYCTWPWFYERDGVDQDGNGQIDEGVDGLQSDGGLWSDDFNELETAAPYARPLRGVKITIRMIEPDTQQVRQVSIVTDFVPE